MNRREVVEYQRMMNNGRSWYCTDQEARRRIELTLPFIAAVMHVAYAFYVSHTSQSTRDYDYRTHVQRMRDGGKKKVLKR